MRSNLPVTQEEYPLEEGRSIVSKTDLKGRITYVNAYFCEVSGFEEHELLGKAHNIVRHPDMPPEAFADLWETLKQDIPWTGLVKNRRKNGDCYWVKANVTPIQENGATIGYMSVRTKPERAEVEAAEQVYRHIRTGQARAIGIRRGAVIKRGFPSVLQTLREVPLSRQVNAYLASLGALLAGTAWLGVNALSDGGFLPASTLTFFLGAAAVVLLQLWHWLQHRVVAQIESALVVARAIAGGDLSRKFEGNHDGDVGQLMRALHQMNVNLIAIVGDVRSNVDSIQRQTHEIATGNADLADRTVSQAASLQRTATSMEELAVTVQSNADGATQVSILAASASDVAARGKTVVTQLGGTMGEIEGSAKQIADIIGLIDSIAFQTNILALNAAVEAARAGEQGKGFAVVASEVRQLAQRSAAAAKDIRTLIGNSVEAIGGGGRLVNDATMTMNEIVDAVNRVAVLMREMSVAGAEQTKGIAEVNEALAHLDDVTHRNTLLVEEAANASEALEEETLHLSQTISVFKLPRALQSHGVSLTASSAAAKAMVDLRPLSRVTAALRIKA